jgi:hypothetical protein
MSCMYCGGEHSSMACEEKDEPPKKPATYKDTLWEADPNCDHHVVCAPGGGVKCTKCTGWFCY